MTEYNKTILHFERKIPDHIPYFLSSYYKIALKKGEALGTDATLSIVMNRRLIFGKGMKEAWLQAEKHYKTVTRPRPWDLNQSKVHSPTDLFFLDILSAKNGPDCEPELQEHSKTDFRKKCDDISATAQKLATLLEGTRFEEAVVSTRKDITHPRPATGHHPKARNANRRDWLLSDYLQELAREAEEAKKKTILDTRANPKQYL